jgi:uncharacterized protein YggE
MFVIVVQPCQAEDMASDCITVFGKAEVLASADQADLTFSVTGYGSTLRAAVDDAKEKTKAVSKELFAVGLKETDLKTSRFHSSENYGTKAFLSNKKDYKAAITTQVTITDLDLLESVIFLLSEKEVDTLSDIRFSVKEDESFKQKARRLSVAKAKQKAVELAEPLDLSVGAVATIEEIPQPDIQVRSSLNLYELQKTSYLLSANATMAQERAGFFTGTIQITAVVKVVFKIQPQ